MFIALCQSIEMIFKSNKHWKYFYFRLQSMEDGLSQDALDYRFQTTEQSEVMNIVVVVLTVEFSCIGMMYNYRI